MYVLFHVHAPNPFNCYPVSLELDGLYTLANQLLLHIFKRGNEERNVQLVPICSANSKLWISMSKG